MKEKTTHTLQESIYTNIQSRQTYRQEAYEKLPGAGWRAGKNVGRGDRPQFLSGGEANVLKLTVVLVAQFSEQSRNH